MKRESENSPINIGTRCRCSSRRRRPSGECEYRPCPVRVSPAAPPLGKGRRIRRSHARACPRRAPVVGEDCRGVESVERSDGGSGASAQDLARHVSLHMLDLGGDVTGNGVSKLVFTILSAVAENERDRIRERIRDVKRHLAQQGIYGGGKRPFGFDVVGDGKTQPKRLVERPDEQAVIVRMRKLRARGESFHKIAAAVGMQPMSVKRILDRAGSQ